MTKVFFATIAFLGMAQIASAATCTTSSRGYSFRESSQDTYTAQDRVIRACETSRYTSSDECRRNVRCDGDNQTPPNQGRGNISARNQFCQSNSTLCTYSLNWNAGNRGSSTIVTVELVGETPQKLFGCSGSSGQANADWIQKGKHYVFRMYESSDCYAQVWNWMAPAAVTDFVGSQY